MGDQLWEDILAVRSSLLPDEFSWRGTIDEQDSWESAYQEYQLTLIPPAIQQVHVALRVNKALGVSMHAKLDGRENQPTVTVFVQRSDLVSHDETTDMVQRRLLESRTHEIPHPLFDILTLLQEAMSERETACRDLILMQKPRACEDRSAYLPQCDMKRVLFWSHHLVAPSKRKQFAAWCPELSVWGVLKLGYPGFLCFEGAAKDIDDMVRRVKGMQWHAISLRVEVPWTYARPKHLDGTTYDGALRACSLAPGDLVASSKLRTRCEEWENMGDFLTRYVKQAYHRLKKAGLQEDEIVEACHLRTAR